MRAKRKTRKSTTRVAWSILLAIGLSSCATQPANPLKERDQKLEELILLLADRKIYEAFTVTSGLNAGPGTRGRLADSLGRSGDPQALVPLEVLLEDEDLEVRRRAAFALGLLGAPAAETSLRLAALDPDRQLGTLAVEALAKLERSLKSVTSLLSALSEEESWARLSPSLYRFSPEEILPQAVLGFGTSETAIRRDLIYALSREPLAEALPILRTFAAEPEPTIRAWIARAFGLVGEGEDVERLVEWLGDTDGVAIQAVFALDRLVQSERVARSNYDGAEAAWLALSSRELPGPRAAAISAAASWPASEAIDRRLLEVATSGSVRELELALVTLAKREPGRGEGPFADRYRTLLEKSVEHDVQTVRSAAAAAAAELGLTKWVEKLAFDPTPGVRMAVHEILLSGAPDEAAASAAWILLDPDDAVRSATVEWLVEQPRLPIEALARSLDGFSVHSPGELPVSIARAVAARAAAEPSEQSAGVQLLKELAESKRYVVRRAAFEALSEMAEEAAPPGSAARDRPANFYAGVVEQSGTRRVVEFETDRGTLQIELDCPAAPVTCLSFLQLVRQGFYEGLAFHRVVPDFVIQTGDPRGDGWGGPGFDLRDEITSLRYERGVLGMAHSGPDTAGSQIFLTLAPQVHLDGRYTAFGRLIAGDAILDRIEQGDTILSAREVEP